MEQEFEFLKPREESDEAAAALCGVGKEALGLGAKVPVLGKHADVALGRERQALRVDQGRPVEEHVKEEDEEEAEENFDKQLHVVAQRIVISSEVETQLPSPVPSLRHLDIPSEEQQSTLQGPCSQQPREEAAVHSRPSPSRPQGGP